MTIVSLNSKRADKSGDCRDWTAQEALESALEAIKTGRLKDRNIDMVYVAMRAKDDKRVSWPYICAGGSTTELVGMLDRHKSMIWEDTDD